MPFCGACGTRVEETARYCMRCGKPLQLPVTAAAPPPLLRPEQWTNTADLGWRLLQAMEIVRNRWWVLVKQAVSDAVSARAIVNGDFQKQHVVSMIKSQLPPLYPYDSVDGENIEGLITLWQLNNVYFFATNVKKYVDQLGISCINEAAAKMADHDPRLITLIAGMFGEAPVDDDCVAAVLAHYFMNDIVKSTNVVATYHAVLKAMPLLRALSCYGTATEFGDVATAQEIMRQIKG